MKWTMMDECHLNDWMELQQTNLMDHIEETMHWCKILGIKFLVQTWPNVWWHLKYYMCIGVRF